MVDLPMRRERFLPAVSSTQFSGPLGIWPWPLINLILGLASRSRATRVSLWEVQRDSEGRITGIMKWEGSD